jgi:hypothetical protein
MKERESDQLARFHEQKKASLVSMCFWDSMLPKKK